jgi:protein-tyrosine phosphatase
MSRLHWIETPTGGRVAIAARPRGDDWLESEITGWKSAGLDVVVSLFEPDEISELGLRREAELCRAQGIEFISFPIADRGLPKSHDETWQLVRFIADGIAAGGRPLIHCRAGIGRSSVIAACALICSGIEAERALALIKDARGVSVPDTEEQRDWVIAFEKAHGRAA